MHLWTVITRKDSVITYGQDGRLQLVDAGFFSFPGSVKGQKKKSSSDSSVPAPNHSLSHELKKKVGIEWASERAKRVRRNVRLKRVMRNDRMNEQTDEPMAQNLYPNFW